MLPILCIVIYLAIGFVSSFVMIYMDADPDKKYDNAPAYFIFIILWPIGLVFLSCYLGDLFFTYLGNFIYKLACNNKETLEQKLNRLKKEIDDLQ